MACNGCRCDEGYALPALNVIWHELPSDHSTAGTEKDGQGRMFKDAAIGLGDASREKRESLCARVAKVAELVAAGDGSQWIIWCDLNDEQAAIEKALDAIGLTYSSLYGAQPVEERERLIEVWRNRDAVVFLGKAMMYGSGTNLQQAHQMVFAGINYKANDVLQAVHRIQRFGQASPCIAHFIYTEAEREIRRKLERKWQQHIEQVGIMTAIIREFGLANAAMAHALTQNRRLRARRGLRKYLAAGEQRLR